MASHLRFDATHEERLENARQMLAEWFAEAVKVWDAAPAGIDVAFGASSMNIDVSQGPPDLYSRGAILIFIAGAPVGDVRATTIYIQAAKIALTQLHNDALDLARLYDERQRLKSEG